MAQTYNFPDVIEGHTFAGTQFTVNVNGSPQDLTGATIEMQLRANNPDGPLIKTFDNGGTGGISIVNAASGIFQIDPFLVDMPPSVLLHDIKITLSGGAVKKWIRGTWCVLNAVTQ